MALRMEVYGVTETTRRSKLRWTPMWRQLLLRGARELILASCACGSPHPKEFAFMNVNMDVDHLHRKSTRDHVHIRAEGSYTQASATYTEGLAVELARAFRDHLRPFSTPCDLEDKKGLEDVMSNDLSTSLDWETVSAWRWKGTSHVNLLEVASGLRVFEEEARRGGDVRLVNLYDSQVALCSINRGRTSSLALRPLLKRASSLSIAFGLYHAGRFTPTRLNPADHPTRDSAIPAPTSSLAPTLPQEVQWLCSLRGLRRWTSNWMPSHGDLQRQKSRAGIELPEGRRVTEKTSSFRTQLLVNFGVWLNMVGTSFDELIWG